MTKPTFQASALGRFVIASRGIIGVLSLGGGAILHHFSTNGIVEDDLFDTNSCYCRPIAGGEAGGGLESPQKFSDLN